MSRWVRGRQGRKIAGIIIAVLLGSLTCSLTPLSADEQSQEGTDAPGSASVMKYFGDGLKKATPLVVLDFENRTTYATGMLGRMAADSLAVELMKTNEFDVVPRTEVDAALTEDHLEVPLSWANQAQLAEKLKKKLVLSGSIDDVHVSKNREGTYAEVSMQVQVISKLTKGPINGAKLVQRSSTKIGYSGNTDALVQEAISTAAYQLVQQMLAHRAVVSTVLTTQSDEGVYLNCGTAQGYKEGTELVTLRRDKVTGRLRVKSTNANDAFADIEGDGTSLAPGDKAVPIFVAGDAEVSAMAEPSSSSTVHHLKKAKNSDTSYSTTRSGSSFDEGSKIDTGSMFTTLAAVGVGIGLYVLLKSNGGRNTLDNPSAPAAAQLASPGSQYPNGANVVTWSSDTTGLAFAYLIYRSDYPALPLAMVENNSFTDGTMVSGGTVDQRTYEFTINPNQPAGQGGSIQVPPHVTSETITAGDPTATPDSSPSPTGPAGTGDYTVTTQYTQPVSGHTYTYTIRTLYVEYTLPNIADPTSQPTQCELDTSLHMSSPSNSITTLAPPTIPAGENPTDGNFSADTVSGATGYWLQVSADTSGGFNKNRTANYPMTNTSSTLVAASVNLQTFISSYNVTAPSGSTSGQVPLWWRVGVAAAGASTPMVFSTAQSMEVAISPPTPASIRGTTAKIPTTTKISGKSRTTAPASSPAGPAVRRRFFL